MELYRRIIFKKTLINNNYKNLGIVNNLIKIENVSIYENKGTFKTLDFDFGIAHIGTNDDRGSGHTILFVNSLENFFFYSYGLKEPTRVNICVKNNTITLNVASYNPSNVSNLKFSYIKLYKFFIN